MIKKDKKNFRMLLCSEITQNQQNTRVVNIYFKNVICIGLYDISIACVEFIIKHINFVSNSLSSFKIGKSLKNMKLSFKQTSNDDFLESNFACLSRMWHCTSQHWFVIGGKVNDVVFVDRKKRSRKFLIIFKLIFVIQIYQGLELCKICYKLF